MNSDCHPSMSIMNLEFFKMGPRMRVNVSLQEVTVVDGSDTAIYAFLTMVNEDGTKQYATVEMTPASAN